jgi:hypothetical protein
VTILPGTGLRIRRAPDSFDDVAASSKPQCSSSQPQRIDCGHLRRRERTGRLGIEALTQFVAILDPKHYGIYPVHSQRVAMSNDGWISAPTIAQRPERGRANEVEGFGMLGIAARLGGWNCYYKPPGPKTMRNGWTRLAAMLEGKALAKNEALP